jgi:hypothetical protein
VHFADPRRGTRAHPAGWLFLPFLAYAAANAAWVTPVGWLGWTDWLNWAQAAAVFWVVLNGVRSRGGRAFLGAMLVFLGVVAAVLACYQHFFQPDWLMLGRRQAAQFIGRATGPFGIPNSLGVLMALLLPPVGALAFGAGRPTWLRAVAGLALAALAAGFVFAISRGAWAALAAAFILKPLLTPGRSLGRRLGAAGAALVLAAAVVTILYLTDTPMRVRLDQLVKDVGEHTRPILWRGAWKIFAAHPWLGGGAGSFNALFEAYRPMGFRDEPFYAHCDYLNTLADYGAVGFVLLFGAALVVAWRAVRARGLAAAAFTGLLAFALHLFVDFHLKIPALAMIVATVAALVTREAWKEERPARGPAPSRTARVAALALACAAVGAAFLWVVPKFRGEALRLEARERIDRMAVAGVDVAKQGVALGEVRAGLARAARLDPRNAQAWSDQAYAGSLSALVTPSLTGELGAEVGRDADRAVALCPVIAEFWIRRGTGLDMEGRWAEGGDCFVRALGLAPMRADVWYYEAYHLSLSPREEGPALAAANLSLRLDPGFLLAQLLRQRLTNRLENRP